MSDILEPNFNGLPKPTDWKKVIVPLQQANEKEFRGATLTELGDNLKIEMSINAQRVPAVPPGALIAGPADREVFMEIKVPGSWTWGTNPPLTNTQGNIATFYWDKTDWKKNDSTALPKGENGQALLPLHSEVISTPGFLGFVKNAQVRDDNGKIYVSLKDLNTDPLYNIASWYSQSEYVNDKVLLKADLGYTEIPALTNIISELVGSDISNTSLWGIGGINSSNGSINPGTISSPAVYRHCIKYYAIPKNVELIVLLQTYFPSSSGLAFYDSDKNFIVGYNSYQADIEVNTSSAKYFRISHHKDLSTNNIYVKNKTSLWSDANSNLAKKDEVVTIDEYEVLKSSSVNKKDIGYENTSINTDFIPQEIKSSDLTDITLWHQNKVYRDSDGTLVGGSGFVCSVKLYPLPKGNYSFKVFLQIFVGNTGLCLYKNDGTFIKCVKSYQQWVNFNTQEAELFSITNRNTLSPSEISLLNNDEITYLKNPIFIPISEANEFVRKGDIPTSLVFKRFSEVEKNNSFPEECEVGKFQLVRNTDVKTGDVTRDYDIKGQNYPSLGKIKIINKKEITTAVYDVAPSGDMYSVNGKNILKSSDLGSTWTIHSTVLEANNLYWVFVIGNGELLAFDRTIRGSTPAEDLIGGVFTSSNNQTTWTKTMNYRNRYIHLEPVWCFEQDGSNLYISEYGNSPSSLTSNDPSWSLGTKADANQIWKSSDFGASWFKYAKLSELVELFPQTGGLVGYLHIHAIHFDQYWKRLWVTTGDGSNSSKSNKKLCWTDDGISWSGIELSGYYNGTPNSAANTAYENLQGLSMISTDQVLLIGADCWNNAIFRVNKRKRNEIFLEDAYYSSPEIKDDITYFTGRIARYEKSPIFITLGQGDSQTSAAQNSRWPKLIATWDGITFFELWKDLNTPQGIAQDWFYVWKIKERYYLHMFYEATNKKYLFEFEL